MRIDGGVCIKLSMKRLWGSPWTRQMASSLLILRGCFDLELVLFKQDVDLELVPSE